MPLEESIPINIAVCSCFVFTSGDSGDMAYLLEFSLKRREREGLNTEVESLPSYEPPILLALLLLLVVVP
jgi:hypothetical protein